MHAQTFFAAAILATSAAAGPLAKSKHQSSSTSSGTATSSGSSAAPSATAAGNSTMNATSGTAPGAVGAVAKTTKDAGPNGAESWFNTGLDGDGWKPPFLDFADLVHIDAQTFYGGAGKACKQYDQYFQSSGPKNNIDPGILAAIAMQESSCNAHPDDGSNGTPGLMQVACDNYPDHSCSGKSIQDNVDAGAKYLRDQLDANKNNVIAAVGAYNGWFQAGDDSPDGGKGLTEGYPCSSAGQGNGQPQNLDYLQETLNGWFQGLDVYGADSYIGSYDCAGSCDSGKKC